MKTPALKPSLAGFNSSKRADRSSVTAFIASYVRAFPSREASVGEASPALYRWMERMLAKPFKGGKVPKAPAKKDWVPRECYIPDNPHPKRSYRWEATNIARAMRIKLDEEKNGLHLIPKR